MIYTTNIVTSPNSPGTWNSLRVEILGDGVKIGEYQRNYHSLMNTFCPFQYDGKDYALYSKDYTATRVMSLPDCKDIAGEDPNSYGFCPVEYFVPQEQTYRTIDKDGTESEPKVSMFKGFHGQYALVSGCVWGDDCSWKLEMINMTELSSGRIRRIQPFDYHELPSDVSIEDAIEYLDLDDGHDINARIAIAKHKDYCYDLQPA